MEWSYCQWLHLIVFFPFLHFRSGIWNLESGIWNPELELEVMSWESQLTFGEHKRARSSLPLEASGPFCSKETLILLWRQRAILSLGSLANPVDCRTYPQTGVSLATGMAHYSANATPSSLLPLISFWVLQYWSHCCRLAFALGRPNLGSQVVRVELPEVGWTLQRCFHSPNSFRLPFIIYSCSGLLRPKRGAFGCAERTEGRGRGSRKSDKQGRSEWLARSKVGAREEKWTWSTKASTRELRSNETLHQCLALLPLLSFPSNSNSTWSSIMNPFND